MKQFSSNAVCRLVGRRTKHGKPFDEGQIMMSRYRGGAPAFWPPLCPPSVEKELSRVPYLMAGVSRLQQLTSAGADPGSGPNADRTAVTRARTESNGGPVTRI